MNLKCFQVQILLKNSVKVSKVEAVSAEARLLAARVNKAILWFFSPCSGLSSLHSLFLLLLYLFFHYSHFPIPLLPLSVQLRASICISGLPSLTVHYECQQNENQMDQQFPLLSPSRLWQASLQPSFLGMTEIFAFIQ